MSTELKYLAFTAILTASLWIPYVVAQVMTNGFLTPPNYVDPTPRALPDWGKRADRTYINAVETFAPFAALVVLIQLTGKADAMTALWAMGYFWLRLAHAVVFLIGLPYIRTLIFVLGYVCVVGLFVELVKYTERADGSPRLSEAKPWLRAELARCLAGFRFARPRAQ